MVEERSGEATAGPPREAAGDDGGIATVSVTVPGLLARFTDGQRTLTLQAETLEDCIERLLESYPPMEPHLFDGSGGPRAHLRLFHDGGGVEWDDAASVELVDGDEVLVLQAVSGG